MLQIPAILLPHFRTNHAGEMGAVFIYKGILFWSKHRDIVKFSREHLSTELNHLKKIEQIIPNKEKSKLIFLWKIMGFLTGFIPSLLGKDFIYATIYNVESFVESHYQEQINMLSNKQEYKKISDFIRELMHDEIKHKEEAHANSREFNLFHKAWGKIVKIGSKTAVSISKII